MFNVYDNAHVVSLVANGTHAASVVSSGVNVRRYIGRNMVTMNCGAQVNGGVADTVTAYVQTAGTNVGSEFVSVGTLTHTGRSAERLSAVLDCGADKGFLRVVVAQTANTPFDVDFIGERAY